MKFTLTLSFNFRMDMLKSVWILVHSILWPSMSYENSDQQTTESSNSNNSLKFQVIGAGLSRTGTFSTRIALTTLLGKLTIEPHTLIHIIIIEIMVIKITIIEVTVIEITVI